MSKSILSQRYQWLNLGYQIQLKELIAQNHLFWSQQQNGSTKESIFGYIQLLGTHLTTQIPIDLIDKIIIVYLDFGDPLILYFITAQYLLEHIKSYNSKLFSDRFKQLPKKPQYQYKLIQYTHHRYMHLSVIDNTEDWSLYTSGHIPHRVIIPKLDEDSNSNNNNIVSLFEKNSNAYPNGSGIYVSRFRPSMIYYRPDIHVPNHFKWVVYTNEQGQLHRDPDVGPALFVSFPHRENDHASINITIFAQNGKLRNPTNDKQPAFNQQIKRPWTRIPDIFTSLWIEADNSDNANMTKIKGWYVIQYEEPQFGSAITAPYHPSLIQDNDGDNILFGDPIKYPINDSFIVAQTLECLTQYHISYIDNTIFFQPHLTTKSLDDFIDYFDPNLSF